MIEKLLAKIRRRKYAYRRMFLGENGELTADGEAVLADLAKFCKATSSTAVVSPISQKVDPVASALAEGRREVFLRIIAHLYLDHKEVITLDEDKE